MQDNDRQIHADQIQAEQYQLSEDQGRPTEDPIAIKWPPDIWEVLTVKYLHDPRQRLTLGKLGVLAGYEVR